MFKIISKKRYEALKKAPEDLKESFDEHYNAEVERRTIAEAEVKRYREVGRLAEIRKVRAEQLTAELDKYKALYADELQKRLDLAEKVARIEEHSTGIETRLAQTEKDLASLRESIPEKNKEAQRVAAGKILRALHCGIPQDDGTLNRDLDTITAFVREEFGY